MNNRLVALSLILILIALNISFFLFNKTNTCNKCNIEFKQAKTSGVEHKIWIYSYHPSELYESLLNNTCIITWEKVGGYHANKEPSF